MSSKKDNEDMLKKISGLSHEEIQMEIADHNEQKKLFKKQEKEDEEKEIRDKKSSEYVIEDAALERKISLICLGDILFEDYFKKAEKYTQNKKHEWFFVVLKHNNQNGKYDHCITLNKDVPNIPEVVEKFGGGKYRFMLKYWDPFKLLKAGKRGGYSLAYRDRTLIDPSGKESKLYNGRSDVFYDNMIKMYDLFEKLLNMTEKTINICQKETNKGEEDEKDVAKN